MHLEVEIAVDFLVGHSVTRVVVIARASSEVETSSLLYAPGSLRTTLGLATRHVESAESSVLYSE